LKIKSGIIDVDSEVGKVFGLTSDKWNAKFTWLWYSNGYIYFSCLAAMEPGKGSLSKLIEKVTELGFPIKIPTPLGIYVASLEKRGFVKGFSEEGQEVWTKEME